MQKNLLLDSVCNVNDKALYKHLFRFSFYLVLLDLYIVVAKLFNYCIFLQAKVAVAEQTEKDIEETRSLYVPMAINTQILFFYIFFQTVLELYMFVFVSHNTISHIVSLSHRPKWQLLNRQKRTLMRPVAYTSPWPSTRRSCFSAWLIWQTLIPCISTRWNGSSASSWEASPMQRGQVGS